MLAVHRNGDAGDTSPNILLGGRQWEYPPIIITYFKFITSQFTKTCHVEITEDFLLGRGTPPFPDRCPGGERNTLRRFAPIPSLEVALTPLIITFVNEVMFS